MKWQHGTSTTIWYWYSWRELEPIFDFFPSYFKKTKLRILTRNNLRSIYGSVATSLLQSLDVIPSSKRPPGFGEVNKPPALAPINILFATYSCTYESQNREFPATEVMFFHKCKKRSSVISGTFRALIFFLVKTPVKAAHFSLIFMAIPRSHDPLHVHL